MVVESLSGNSLGDVAICGYRVYFWSEIVIDTHFCDTFHTSPFHTSPTSLWAQLMYYIIFYFILLSMAQAHAIYGKIEKVWFRGYGLVHFGPFAWAQPMRTTKWARDAGSTSGSWKRSCTQNFHLKRVFILWVTVAQSFYPNLNLLLYFLFHPKNTTDPKLIS